MQSYKKNLVLKEDWWDPFYFILFYLFETLHQPFKTCYQICLFNNIHD